MIDVLYDVQADILRITFFDAEHSRIKEITPFAYASLDKDGDVYEIHIHGLSLHTENPDEISFKRIEQVFAQTMTVDQFAELHDMHPNSVRKILQDDQQLTDDQKKLPGAYKEGGHRRGTWKIPIKSAANWAKSNRGRPKEIEVEA